jgi:hypothetical protein
MAIALLHSWSEDISTPGLFVLHDGLSAPGAWRLKGVTADPKAFPTPLARAEATSHVLRGGEEAAGHELAVRFKLLAYGLTLGKLQYVLLDLAAPELDNLGRALVRVEPDSRYLGLVGRGSEGAFAAFGATHPECLLFPHARRSRADWDDLAGAVGREQDLASRLLADLRAALDAADAWNPEVVAWQSGIECLLGQQTPSPDLIELRRNARFIGPFVLRVAGASGEKTLQAIYWPVVHREYTQKVVEYFKLKPTRTAEFVELRDAVDNAAARVLLPMAGENVDPVALGAGQIEIVPQRELQPQENGRLFLQCRGGQPGLVDLLRPVETALRDSHFGPAARRASAVGAPLSQEQAQQCPVFFPDSIRIIADMGLWRGEGEADAIRFSRRCEEVVFGPGGPGRYPEVRDADSGSVVVRLETGAGPVRVAFVERCGGTEVGDLRALGLLLFQLFVGEAELDAEAGGIVDGSFTPLVEQSVEHPLEPVADLYARSSSPVEAERLGRRLATLQRFVRSYRSGDGTAGADRLLWLAARALATWARGGVEVLPLGLAAERTLRYRLPGGGQEIIFARDHVELAQFAE